MGRYSKIILGPARRNDPQVTEAQANVAIKPGTFVTFGTAGAAARFVLATATSTSRLFLAQENYLMLKGVDEDYRAPVGATSTPGDLVMGLELEDDILYAARLAAGQNVAKGAPLAVGANGNLVAAGASAKVIAFADEALNNTESTAELIRIRPAGSQARVNPA